MAPHARTAEWPEGLQAGAARGVLASPGCHGASGARAARVGAVARNLSRSPVRGDPHGRVAEATGDRKDSRTGPPGPGRRSRRSCTRPRCSSASRRPGSRRSWLCGRSHAMPVLVVEDAGVTTLRDRTRQPFDVEPLSRPRAPPRRDPRPRPRVRRHPSRHQPVEHRARRRRCPDAGRLRPRDDRLVDRGRPGPARKSSAARFSATRRPSSSGARTASSTLAATSTRWGRCSTRCSPERHRFDRTIPSRSSTPTWRGSRSLRR